MRVFDKVLFDSRASYELFKQEQMLLKIEFPPSYYFPSLWSMVIIPL